MKALPWIQTIILILYAATSVVHYFTTEALQTRIEKLETQQETLADSVYYLLYLQAAKEKPHGTAQGQGRDRL